MKYVAWVPIHGLFKVEIESDHELKSSDLRREIMQYVDEETNPLLGEHETLKDITTRLELLMIKIELQDDDVKVSQIEPKV